MGREGGGKIIELSPGYYGSSLRLKLIYSAVIILVPFKLKIRSYNEAAS